MECQICKRSEDITELFKGIYDNEIINVCESCAELEQIPLIKKPEIRQLEQADKSLSVRERLENLSGFNKKKQSKEHILAHSNLGRLRMPEKKQDSEKLIDNYDWEIKITRRRKKISTLQLSEQTGINQNILDEIEKGILPEDIENTFIKIESALGIKLLKEHARQIYFKSNINSEKEILNEVRERMGMKPIEIHEENDKEFIEIQPDKTKEHEMKKEIQSKKQENIIKIKRGELDFSRAQNIKDITLNDLMRMKKEKDRRTELLKRKQEHEELFGEDLEFEED